MWLSLTLRTVATLADTIIELGNIPELRPDGGWLRHRHGRTRVTALHRIARESLPWTYAALAMLSTYVSMACLWLSESSRLQSAKALAGGSSRVSGQYQKGVRQDARTGMLRALR